MMKFKAILVVGVAGRLFPEQTHLNLLSACALISIVVGGKDGRGCRKAIWDGGVCTLGFGFMPRSIHSEAHRVPKRVLKAIYLATFRASRARPGVVDTIGGPASFRHRDALRDAGARIAPPQNVEAVRTMAWIIVRSDIAATGPACAR
jgi:hypothetical protein